MVNRWSLAVVGCLIVLGLGGRTDAATRPSIAVVAYNQAAAADEVVARAKVVIARIYDAAGIDVIWIEPSAAAPPDRFAVRLLIRPRAIGAMESVMGTAIGDLHESGGAAFVFYDRVLESAHLRHQDVAGVLAYAMAHEMGHLLLPAPAHAESGIMRPSWDGDDLRHIADGSMRFTPLQQAAIRAKATTCCPIAAGR